MDLVLYFIWRYTVSWQGIIYNRCSSDKVTLFSLIYPLILCLSLRFLNIYFIYIFTLPVRQANCNVLGHLLLCLDVQRSKSNACSVTVLQEIKQCKAENSHNFISSNWNHQFNSSFSCFIYFMSLTLLWLCWTFLRY